MITNNLSVNFFEQIRLNNKVAYIFTSTIKGLRSWPGSINNIPPHDINRTTYYLSPIFFSYSTCIIN